jgi:hypothetical protein
MKTVLAIAIAALFATGLVACGGDDDGPSKTAYIEKADALCAATDLKIDAALRFDAEPSAQQAAAALRTVLPEERKLLSDLRALEKPKADETEIDRIYDAWERANDALEAASKDPRAALEFISVGENEGAFGEPRRLAQTYEMVNCGESTPTLGGQP